jgi:hypothetical protein
LSPIVSGIWTGPFAVLFVLQEKTTSLHASILLFVLFFSLRSDYEVMMGFFIFNSAAAV